MATLSVRNPNKHNRFSLKRLSSQSFAYLVLIAGTLVTLVPFVWVILTSLKPASEIIRIPPTFFPKTWTLDSYRTIFNDPKVPLELFYLNSLFVAVFRVFTTIFTSTLAGFIFAKYRFWGKDAIFGFILVQLMIPF
jgi:multiple sugar transport system permease protein